MLERCDRAVSERLVELVLILCTADCVVKDERFEAAATGCGLRSELEELASFCGITLIVQVSDLDVFEVWALLQELLQWPVLQDVGILPTINRKFLEALLLVDRVPEHVDERVHHVGRGALDIL